MALVLKEHSPREGGKANDHGFNSVDAVRYWYRNDSSFVWKRDHVANGRAILPGAIRGRRHLLRNHMEPLVVALLAGLRVRCLWLRSHDCFSITLAPQDNHCN